MLARIGDAFHVLPSVVARALDEDPEQLDLVCLELLSYASIKDAFDRAGNDDKAIEHLKDHPYMLQVRRNAFDLHGERLAEFRKKQAEAAPPEVSRREAQASMKDGTETVAPLRRERRTHGR